MISATSAITGQLDAAITRTLGILTGQIDKLMELFRVTNRQFYDEYQAARLTIGGSGGGATPPPAPPPA